jgi:glycylpeptide N-tetradecanoyltransferase
MAESTQVKASGEEDKLPTTTLEHVVDEVEEEEEEDDKTLQPESSSASKSKKKKKKSKLKNLLNRKANEEILLAEVEDAISSTTLEEKKELSKQDQAKLEMIIKKMNEMLPGGRKDIADHKFWKTQPVIKFGKNALKLEKVDVYGR